MIADYYVDTKNQLETRYFDSEKCILKQMQRRI